MKEAPTTERIEVTFSVTSKVCAWDGVTEGDMSTVECAVPLDVHTEFQVTRSKSSQEVLWGEGYVFCVWNILVVGT